MSMWTSSDKGEGGISEPEHFICKYKFIPDVRVDFISQVFLWGGYIWIGTLHLNIHIVIWCLCGLNCTGGGYAWICTVHSYVISMSISSFWLHLVGGCLNLYSSFICDINVHFIFLTSSGGGYIWSYNSLHLKSVLSLLTLWALEHWTM